MAITLNGSTGITNDGGYTGDGVVFADTTPANTLVTTTGGNVGIGTSSPSGAKVQIVGDNSALRVGDGTRDMYVDPDSGGIFLSNGAGQTGEGFYLAASGNTLRMYTSSTERARIDSNGNLLVGLTSSAGGIIQSVSSVAGTQCYLAWNTAASGTRYFHYFGVGSGGSPSGVGSITSTGTSTAFNTTSDYRLKENIAPMTGALAKVQQLKPCTYTWKADGSNGQGFIAHELQAVVSDAVVGEKDAVDDEGNPVYQGIDTSFLVATLTAAIQELNAKVEAQAAEIAALKAA